MKVPTHFRCDSCNRIKPLSEAKVVKCEYTCFDNDSKNKFSCYHYHIQLCKKCTNYLGGMK